MNRFEPLQLVSIIGSLILVGSAFAGYRLSWKRGLVMALAWVGIFGLITLIVGQVL